MRLILVALATLALSACATGPSQEQIRASHERAIAVDRDLYTDCVFNQAERIISQYESPHYIAMTAHAMCGREFGEFEVTTTRAFMAMPGRFETLKAGAEGVVTTVRERTQNEVIRLATEVKLKVKPTQAPKPKSAYEI